MIMKYVTAIVFCLFLSIVSGKELTYNGDWSIESNKNSAVIGNVFDGNLETTWNSGTAQEVGDNIKINFNKEVLVYGLVLTVADQYSFPRAVEISASQDGKSWITLTSEKNYQKETPIRISAWNTLNFSFKSSIIKYLKISITESCGLPLKISGCSILGQDISDNIKTDRSVIIIPQSATPTIAFAAEELQKYLGRMGYFVMIHKTGKIDTSRYSDYVFRLGTGNAPGFGTDGYTIQNTGKDILVSGNSDMSVLYGTYTLLERLGVRWFCPYEEGESIPDSFLPRVLDKIDIAETPSFLARGFVEPYFWDTQKIMWCVRNKINSMGTNVGWNYLFLANPGIEKIGGKDYYYANAGWVWPNSHSFNYFIPTSKYFKDFPEYFPLIDGKRVGGDWQQVCTSNPEVIKIFKEKIFEYLSKNPSLKVVSVMPNDGALKWCECEKCRKLDGPDPKEISHCNQMCRLVTDRYLVLAREIAEEVKQKYPNVKIQIFAYSVFKAPPVYIKEMPDNVIMQICQYGEPAQIIGTVDENKYMLEWMQGWANIKGPSLSVYDYFLLREEHPELHTPLFFTEALFHKLKLYRNNLNVKYYQTQFAWSTQNENPLLFYSYVKALWNVEIDKNKFYNDFFSKYYGKASVPMGKYFRMMMERVKEKNILYVNNYNCPPPKDLYDAEIIPVIDKLFADANKLADKEFIVKQRIRRDWYAYQYAKKYLNLNQKDKSLVSSKNNKGLIIKQYLFYVADSLNSSMEGTW